MHKYLWNTHQGEYWLKLFLPAERDADFKLRTVVFKADDDVEDHGHQTVEDGDRDGRKVANQKAAEGTVCNWLIRMLEEKSSFT